MIVLEPTATTPHIRSRLPVLLFSLLATCGMCAAASFHLIEIPNGQAPLGYVEIQGVGAGAFRPASWQNNQLHWVREERMPLLAPRLGGAFRNIYAPSAVEDGAGWLFFYSAWDGTESGNDRVYMSRTPDFIDFYDRHTVIHNGDFVHVSNVNVQRLDSDRLENVRHRVARSGSAKQTHSLHQQRRREVLERIRPALSRDSKGHRSDAGLRQLPAR